MTDPATVATAAERWRHYSGGDLQAYISHLEDAKILAEAYLATLAAGPPPPQSIQDAAYFVERELKKCGGALTSAAAIRGTAGG